ncbi:uncharacterized protein MEPE_03556 [Melanopsichium pennsylvanicum]|uniref:Uncharacterized protein n=1 Tax=Melanopsichium pennsylvanicum TaxID=63383 RepID=A0AAJ4XM80_9BASI|nr:uncharacterized protein MEPE_03556 [Melanopsichium pennsylvanicum]
MRFSKLNTLLHFALTTCITLTAAASISQGLPESASPLAPRLKCTVDGDDSPEAALRQVDPHALSTMYCAIGCDYVVNNAIPHPQSTSIKPNCFVDKVEDKIVMKKYKAKDGKDENKRRRQEQTRKGGKVGKRDIDAYTVEKATFTFSCTHPNGQDYTEAAANWIKLEMSICKKPGRASLP